MRRHRTGRRTGPTLRVSRHTSLDLHGSSSCRSHPTPSEYICTFVFLSTFNDDFVCIIFFQICIERQIKSVLLACRSGLHSLFAFQFRFVRVERG